MPINIEIKAHCKDINKVKVILEEKNAIYKGIDHQIDTYFQIASGRLKLRQGNIENNLIHYQRSNQAGPKLSEVALYPVADSDALLQVLSRSMPIKIIVDKQRAIYFINNVKFHLDNVKGLGTFVEIEAIDTDDSFSQQDLKAQCDHYMTLFNIAANDLIDVSYSDLLTL